MAPAVKTFVCKHGQFQFSQLSSFQPMKLSKTQSDVLISRRRTDQSSDIVHHRLASLDDTLPHSADDTVRSIPTKTGERM